jgi:hypothetical protein
MKMFEMVFPDGKRRGMAFDGHDHGVFMTKGGSMITKKDWPKMKRTLAYNDNELSGSGERDGAGTQEDLAKLRATIKALARKSGKDDGEYQKMLDNVLGHHGQSDGAAATDGPLSRHKVPGGDEDDEDDEFAEFRKLLRGKGLDDESVERAVGHARRDREEAEDVLPHNALGGRLHGRTGSGSIRPDSDAQLEKQYPGISRTSMDPYGAPRSDENPYDPTRRLGERLAERLPSGGSGRRLSNDAGLAADEDIERVLEQDYGSSGPAIGMFGR